VIERLTATLADRYRIERELGAGGMAIASTAALADRYRSAAPIPAARPVAKAHRKL
jgi:hypothetical protein